MHNVLCPQCVYCTLYWCRVYNANCMVSSVCCTLYCAQYCTHCILYTIVCIVYTVQCTVYSVYCTEYIVQCILYSVYCTGYTVQCTLYSVYCTVYSIHWSLIWELSRWAGGGGCGGDRKSSHGNRGRTQIWRLKHRISENTTDWSSQAEDSNLAQFVTSLALLITSILLVFWHYSGKKIVFLKLFTPVPLIPCMLPALIWHKLCTL